MHKSAHFLGKSFGFDLIPAQSHVCSTRRAANRNIHIHFHRNLPIDFWNLGSYLLLVEKRGKLRRGRGVDKIITNVAAQISTVIAWHQAAFGRGLVLVFGSCGSRLMSPVWVLWFGSQKELLMAQTQYALCHLRCDFWQTGRGTRADPQSAWHTGQNILSFDTLEAVLVTALSQLSQLLCPCKVNVAVMTLQSERGVLCCSRPGFVFSVVSLKISVVLQQICLNLTSIKESIRDVNNCKPANLMRIIMK